MNELLQKHGCSNVFTVPEGLKELMADISREVLRDQPPNICEYIANYLSALLITREHGVLAVKILDDLCDCQPSVSEHLFQLGMDRKQAAVLSEIIKEEIEEFEPVSGKEKVKETQILKKILTRSVLDEDMAAKVCQVARNAYRDYWYRKKLMDKSLKVDPEEAWEIAAERTLEIYKKTKPSFSELTRATEKIQAAYRGYHVRRNILRHLKPKSKKKGPKVELAGPPLDVADSREIDLGPVLKLKIRDEDTRPMFDEIVGEKLGLQYDPMKTITYQDDKKTEERSTAKFQLPTPFAKDSSPALDLPKTLELPPSPALSLKALTPFEGPVRGDRMSPAPSQIQAETFEMPLLARELSDLPEPFPEPSFHKISFAEEPAEVFEEVVEVPEDIPAEHEETEGADADEITEDIPDDRTEGSESAPLASVPSSTPDTANSTDVEDVGVDGDEEEGE